jgi:hypothetical protein
MAENMNGLGSKTKYEYPMAKAREGSKSIIDSLFDFVGYSDPIPEYQKSPSKQRSNAEEKGLTKEFDGTSPLDDILPPLSRILEKFNSKLGAITTGYVKPTAYKKYLPLQAAALLATAEAESATSLRESGYLRTKLDNGEWASRTGQELADKLGQGLGYDPHKA